jgi:LuxR family maltose regulon positive regulatory protein
VIRDDVLDRLDEAIAHKLTLIAAPPGYGKTTLLSIWIREHNLSAAWLSLDIEDNDPARFLQYFIAAMQTIVPQVGQASLAMLKSPQSSTQTAILSTLINDLAKLQADLILILDDYHWIEQQKVHDALIYLIDHLPAQIHLVVASRSDPPLQLSLLRARNQLLEIRQSDLRMKPEEASNFLNQCMELNLSPEQVESLGSRTEGWVAGLQLAALSLKGKDDIDAFINTFSGSHRFVIDYLADEVIANQPPEVKSFLRKTSILDRFSAPLCDEMTGRDDSKDILRYLEETNLFLIPLDDQREWYRYHHLFLDYLRIDLKEKSQTDLQIKASQWFLDNGLYTEAVKYAIPSGDEDQVVTTLSQAAPLAIEQATFASLFGWFDALPDSIIRQNGVLSLYKSFALFFTESYREALPYARAAQNNLPPDLPTSIQGQLLCIQAHIALFRNNLKGAIRNAREALEYLSEEDIFFRSLTLNLLGQVLEMKSDVISAAEVYRQGFEAGYKTGEKLGTFVVFTNLIFSLNELGKLKEGITLCEQVNSEIGQEAFAGEPLTNVINISWSLLSFESNRLETAQRQAQSALDTLLRGGISQGVSLAQYVLARLHLINQEWDQLSQLIQQGAQLAKRTGTDQTQGTWFSALEAQASLERGDLDAASHWVEKMGFTPDDKPHHWVELPYFTYSRILLKQSRHLDAQQLLNTMESSAQEGRRLRKLITIYLLMALADLGQDHRESAIQHLEGALSIAAPQGYQRAFFDEDHLILDLLPQVRHAAPEFVDELLATSTHVPELSPSPDSPYEPLSERELEVLNLVSKGYSNRQIAEALYITLGTVKKHLNNIFGKLQVKNRTQSVTRARELNLLT